MAVFNKIYTVIGARNQGKTPFIIGGDYEQGLASIYLKKGMSVLIIDELDHPKYRHIPFLHPKDYLILSQKAGIYRTIAEKSEMKNLFPHLKKVWNTLIVFEDCYKYIGHKLTDDQMAVLGNSKNQNNCLVFMHWCWGFAQPDILRMTNYYVIFKTPDSPEDRKTYIKGCYNQCILASQKVKTISKGKPYIVVDSGI